MKKCPNCGAMMSADTNFCTNCGADLRSVPVEKPVEQMRSSQVDPMPMQQAMPNMQSTSETEQSVQPNSQMQATNQTNQVNQVNQMPMQQPMQNNAQMPVQNQMQQPSGFSIYWQWFVNSLKRPDAKQHTEKWYGIVNLLVEILLTTLTLGKLMNTGASSLTGMMGGLGSSFASQKVQSISFQLFFGLVITTAIMIAAAMLANIFIYGQKLDFTGFINDVAQYSNYNLALGLLAFLISLTGSSYGLLTFLMFMMVLIFNAAIIVPALGNGKAKRDRVFGTLILLIGLIIAVCVLIGFGGSAARSIFPF